MESELEQDRSIQADVRPVSRFLRFGLATIASLVLVGFILGVMRATGMLVRGDNHFFFPLYLGQLVQFAPVVGIAAAAYPRRWLSSRHNAFIVAVVGAAVGCLCYYVLQERIAWLSHHAATNTRYAFWEVTPVFKFQMAWCWIATGALAMLVTLTRRTPRVLVSAAVLCVLAVVLPSPVFNFVRHNQELTVSFVVPADPGASAARPPHVFSISIGPHWLSQAGADAVAAHVLEAMRKAGLPGQYRVAEVNQSGTGKKALQIIVLNPPVPADAQLPQPNGTELIYVSSPDGWRTIPAQAPTLGRNTEIQGPKTGYRWIATYWIHTAAYPEAFGGAIWPACSQDQSRFSDSQIHQFPGCR
jgi:hypothetical protein